MDAATWRGRASAVLLAVLALSISGPWGGGAPAPRSAARAGVPGSVARGARLFRASDCARCHSEPRRDRRVQIPPSLDIEGSRARPDWLAEYLLAPHPLRYAREGIRPDLRMPAIVSSARDAADLAALLATWTDRTRVPVARPPLTIAAKDSAARTPLASAAAEPSAREGAILFDQYQCRGCHELAGAGKKVGPALDGVGDRRQPEYVRALLLDPQSVVPGTSMKDFDLWDEEADALTLFLMTLRAPRKP